MNFYIWPLPMFGSSSIRCFHVVRSIMVLGLDGFVEIFIQNSGYLLVPNILFSMAERFNFFKVFLDRIVLLMWQKRCDTCLFCFI